MFIKEECMAAKVDREKCTGCAVCVDVCPVEAIKIENDKAVISDDCSECGACTSECPNDAISV
jgi:Pyruvate/2-oxoacid:ferredoxin oxidoreductase delta subunit